jgi:hypothetical protein
MAIRRSDGVTAEPPLAQDTVIAVERIEMDGSADLYAAPSAAVRASSSVSRMRSASARRSPRIAAAARNPRCWLDASRRPSARGVRW